MAPFIKDELRVMWGILSYQKAEIDQWERLETTYRKSIRTFENVREIVLSGGSLCISQFGRPPVNDLDKLVLDSQRWTIKFKVQKMSNLRAREFVEDGQKSSTIEIVFDYMDSPTGFESSKLRNPNARNPQDGEANTSGDEGPGPPKFYPLPRFARNYTNNDVKRVRLSFPRSLKSKGARVWAWPLFVAMMLGEPHYSTNLCQASMLALFEKNLDDHAKGQRTYAELRPDGTGWWQIAKMPRVIEPPEPVGLSAGVKVKHSRPERSQKSHVVASTDQHDVGTPSSDKRHSKDDPEHGNARNSKIDLEAERDQRNHDKRYRDATARILRERIVTLDKKLNEISREYQEVDRELDAAKQELKNLEREQSSLE